MRRTFAYLLSTFLLAALFLSCSRLKKDDTVAVVDGEEIPVTLITRFFENTAVIFSSAEEELQMKRDALDSLIDYRMLIKGAYAAGLDKDQEVLKLLEADKSNFLFDELYRQEILPQVEVSDAEVDEFYDKLKTEYHVSHILTATEKQADSVAAELKKGADFAAIAREISFDQSSAVKGGDLGWVSWGTQTDPNFRNAVFTLKPGETSAPIRTQWGWHIVHCLESRPTSLSDKKTMDPAIREVLRSRKSQAAEAKFLSEMEAKAQVEINPEATQMLLDRLNQFFPSVIGNASRPDNYFPQIDLLKPFERQMVLASYQGGEVTVEDYLKKIAEVQEIYRPRFDNVDSLKKVIFQLEVRNIMEYEASQRNVEKGADFQKRLNDFKEGIMADKFQRSILGRSIDVTEDEIDQYYGSHVEDFMTPRQFHLWEIETDSSAEAERLLEQLKRGADFGELAAKHTVRPGFRQKRGDLGMVTKSLLPLLYKAAESLDRGQFSDVVTNEEGKFSVIRLTDVKEGVIRPVEECALEIKQKIINLKRASVASDWIKEQRSKSKIEIFTDVLEKSIDKSKYDKKS